MTVKTTGDKATLQEIKDAYGKQHGTPTPPAGFDNPEWLDSDLNTPAKGSYPPGSELFIGFNPIKTGYTAAVTLAGAEGGKREFITNDAWDGPQTLSGILTEADITDPSNPGTPPTDWTFKGWAEADKYPEIIDPGTYSDPSTTYQSGTTFVAVYEVPYKINIDGITYTVEVPVTAPNEGATWEQIKAAALALPDSTIPAAAKAKLDTLTWGAKKPGDTEAAEFEGGVQFPANTSFEALVEYSYKITDANGKEVEVDFGLLPSTTEITLDQIIAKANENDHSVDFGSDYGGNGFVKISDWNVSTSDPIAPGVVKPTKKELTYFVTYKPTTDDYGEYPVKVTVPADNNSGVSLQNIFVAAGMSAGNVADVDKSHKETGTDLAAGWKVNDEKIVSSKEINDNKKATAQGPFPAGTTITPNWIKYGDGGSTGFSGRNVTDETESGPQIGDILINREGEGIVIAKSKKDEDLQPGDKIRGYIYKVEPGNKISVVSCDVIGPQVWANAAAAYNGTGVSGKGALNVHTKQGTTITLPDLQDGYAAWTDVIYDWNPDARYGNYKALKLALTYPTKHTDSSFQSSTENNADVNALVNGNDVDSRWYLPSVTELQAIYAAGDKLLNWTSASHAAVGKTDFLNGKTFWSVNVSGDANTSAKYVPFTDESTKNSDGNPESVDKKKDTSYYIIPVAQFVYE